MCRNNSPPPSNGKPEQEAGPAGEKPEASTEEEKPKAPKKDRVESAEETRKQASSTAKVELTFGQQFRQLGDTFAYQA